MDISTTPTSSRPDKTPGDWFKLVLAVIVGISIPVAFYAVPWYQQAKKEKAAKAAEIELPHQEVSTLIDDLRKNAHELPHCPLIYPLLDKNKKVTQLGSYLSYVAMLEASYLPEKEFNPGEIGDFFLTYGLFEPSGPPSQKYYKSELPKDLQVKDFGEGTWTQNKRGYTLTLRFWGTHPEKKFKKKFDKKSLHMAPNWMAQCLHSWVGFQDNPQQAKTLAQPAFANDADLIKAAHVEILRRYCPGLIVGWNQVTQNAPDSTIAFCTGVDIADDLQHTSHPELFKQRLAQYPQDDLLKFRYAKELQKDEKYAEANGQYIELLRRDSDDPLLFTNAIDNLENWNFYKEAAQLSNAWCELHPNDPEAWIEKVYFYRDYAWEARGSGWANSVTAEGWKLMKERIGTAVMAAEKAVQVAPQYYRSWESKLALGTGAELKPELMEEYFQKTIDLNPVPNKAYRTYLNYQLPKWFGTDVQAFEFVRKYWKNDPYLVYDAATETFWDYNEAKTEEEKHQKRLQMQSNVAHSPYLPIFKSGMREYFTQHPYDTLNWGYYIYWMLYLDKRDETLAFAKKLIPKDPEFQIVYPVIVLNTLEMEGEYLTEVTYPHSTNYELRPDVIKLRGDAYRALVKADPDNVNYLNRLAKFDMDNEFYKEAKKCMIKLGDRWDASVWGKFKFNKARKDLGLPDMPSLQTGRKS